MNKSLLLLVALFALMLGGYFVANTETAFDSLKIQTAIIHLVEPVSIEKILKEITNYNIDLLAFHCRRRFKNRVITDGYYLTPEDKRTLDDNTLQERYWLSFGAMLDDLYRDMEMSTPEMGSEVAWQDYVEQINQARRNFSPIHGCWETHNCPIVYVVSILVRGEKTSLSAMLNSPLVGRVEFSQAQDEINSLAATPTPNATPAPYNLWVPNRGSIHVQPSVVQGERYILNRMSWDTATRLSAFGSTSTYEHDLFLNDSDSSLYGPGTYLSDAQDLVGIPIVSHWSSDLPQPYLDTRFGDEDYIKAYTIGSAEADSLQPVAFYYYYIRTPNGDADIDNGYLLAQIGRRVQSNCYTTWCVFGVQDPEAIYPPYEVDPIPGDFFWVFSRLYLPLIIKSSQSTLQSLPYPPPSSSQEFQSPIPYPYPLPP